MVELRWIKMSLFLILLLHFTAVTGQDLPAVFAREGSEVTLPCENVIYDQQQCDRASWYSSRYTGAQTVYLINSEQSDKNSEDKSSRLRVTENCSLVIQNVTTQDVGLYFCRWTQSGQSGNSFVYLNIISIQVQHSSDMATSFSCSVLTYAQCTYTVRWLYNSSDVNKPNEDERTSPSRCLGVLYIQNPDFNLNYNFLTCEVKNGKAHLFPLIPRFTSERPGENTVTATTTMESTTTKPKTTENGRNDVISDCTDCSAVNYIMLFMRVAELLLVTVITVLLFIRARGKQKPPHHNDAHHGGDGHDLTENYENVGGPTVRIKNTDISQPKK